MAKLVIPKPQIKIGGFSFRSKSVGAVLAKWAPNADHPDGRPNPQRLALESKADILGYGGAAGGGKTDLLLGLAATEHHHSVIFRRTFPNLRGIIERSRDVFGPLSADRENSYNEALHRWVMGDGKMVEFEACQYEKDKEKQRGRPRDFYGFDEATEFTLTQIQFITGWLRSTRPGQRKRVVMTFNPPSSEAGNWVIDYFLPWLAYLFPQQFTHPKPARPGELRWYTTIDGKEMELESGEPVLHNGELIRPLSRTFIPARLQDNPYLANTNYSSIIDSMPEPLRSQLKYGDFATTTSEHPFQVIPTAWVLEAQKRWQERERPDVPLTGVGVDPARGGRDNTGVAKRYDNYFEIAKFPGSLTTTGGAVAEVVRQVVGDDKPGYVNVDIIGVGSSGYDHLKILFDNVVGVNAAGGTQMRDRSGTLKMRNVRAAYHWAMREALDPVNGLDLALPPDKELMADLCAARYEVTAAGVTIESKDEIKARIGRSPDMGEAVMLALYYDNPAGKLLDAYKNLLANRGKG
jgi:hypothetical protein